MEFENFTFWPFYGQKRQKSKMAAIFWQFFAHKMAKIQKFESIRFLELLTRKVHAKFQVPSMHGVQMNVLFVLYEESRFEVRAPIAITHEPRFSKINCSSY